MRLSAPSLEVLAAMRADDTTVVSEEAPGHPATALHHARGLIAHAILHPVQHRPLTVRLADHQFARGLHGLVVISPHLRPVIAGSGLTVIALLAEGPTRAVEVARAARIHVNTVHKVVHSLRNRALLVDRGDGRIELAPHAEPLRLLGILYARHLTEQKIAHLAGPVTIRHMNATTIVETPAPNPGRPLTAASRFQEDGAAVVAARYAYRIHPFHDHPVSLDEALRDAEYIQTPPRTLEAMRAHLAHST